MVWLFLGSSLFRSSAVRYALPPLFADTSQHGPRSITQPASSCVKTLKPCCKKSIGSRPSTGAPAVSLGVRARIGDDNTRVTELSARGAGVAGCGKVGTEQTGIGQRAEGDAGSQGVAACGIRVEIRVILATLEGDTGGLKVLEEPFHCSIVKRFLSLKS